MTPGAAPPTSNCYPMRFAHSTSAAAAAAAAYSLNESKPDPRRVHTAHTGLHQYPFPAPAPPGPSGPTSSQRPCSHSATPSPRTPQSLGNGSASVFSNGSAGPKQVSPSMTNNHSTLIQPGSQAAISLAAADEFYRKMLEAYPHCPPQQVAEMLAMLRMVSSSFTCVLNHED